MPRFPVWLVLFHACFWYCVGAPLAVAQWYDDYKNLAAIYTRLDDFATSYPDLVTPLQIGSSYEGRDIRGVRIAGTNPSRAHRPAILMNSLQHAREWVSGMTTMYAADQLLAGYSTDVNVQRVLDDLEIIVIPVVNPDGYEYSWTNDRYWRKNRRPLAMGEYGVDLNRNWDFGWGLESGSSSDPEDPTYRGTAPFSEPETVAMRDFYMANPQIVSNIDFHAYSQLILTPFGYTEAAPADNGLLLDVATNMSSAIQSVHGKTYVPQSASDLYLASGVSIDWTYGDQGVYSWTVELRPETFFPGFELPASEILPTAEENFAGVLELADFTMAVASGDYNVDGAYDCVDLDMLMDAIFQSSNKYQYDLDGNGLMDHDDLDRWLEQAGEQMVGGAFLPGDADLNGVVDGADFATWNAHKFQPTSSYCSGDFNADGFVDGADLLIWNAYKFTSSDAVPEPNSLLWLFLVGFALAARRRP